MSNDKTLATTKHGGCVQLGGGLPPIREDEPLRGDEPAGEQHDARMFNRGWNACREAAAALSAQPSPGGQGAALALADQLRAIAESEHSTSQNAADDTGYLPSDVIDTLNRAAAALAARQPAGEPVTPWRDHSAAVDTKALATATEIALMWGKDRSQFVSRIQAAVIDAMQWMNGGLLEKPAQAEDLGQLWRLSDAWLAKEQDRATDKIYGRALWACAKELRDVLALIDGKAVGK